MMEQMIVELVREENKALMADMRAFGRELVDNIGKAYARRFMPDAVTVRDACKQLTCEPRELTARMNAAGIAPKKRGGRWTITRDEFIRLMPEVEI